MILIKTIVKDHQKEEITQMIVAFGLIRIGQRGQKQFLYRVDYKDYVTYPLKVKPHYHLCYPGYTECKKHYYF